MYIFKKRGQKIETNLKILNLRKEFLGNTARNGLRKVLICWNCYQNI